MCFCYQVKSKSFSFVWGKQISVNIICTTTHTHIQHEEIALLPECNEPVFQTNFLKWNFYSHSFVFCFITLFMFFFFFSLSLSLLSICSRQAAKVWSVLFLLQRLQPTPSSFAMDCFNVRPNLPPRPKHTEQRNTPLETSFLSSRFACWLTKSSYKSNHLLSRSAEGRKQSKGKIYLLSSSL